MHIFNNLHSFKIRFISLNLNEAQRLPGQIACKSVTYAKFPIHGGLSTVASV